MSYRKPAGPQPPNAPWVDLRTPRVYFIQQGDTTGPIKIGTALDHLKRLANLQTSNPYPLVLLATTAGGADVERSLHNQFATSRIRGEWFTPSPELLIRGCTNTNIATTPITTRDGRLHKACRPHHTAITQASPTTRE